MDDGIQQVVGSLCLLPFQLDEALGAAVPGAPPGPTSPVHDADVLTGEVEAHVHTPAADSQHSCSTGPNLTGRIM